MLSATYASCSPWLTLMIRSPGLRSGAHSSLVKWFSTRIRIGSATSAAPKDFSLGSPKNLAIISNGYFRESSAEEDAAKKNLNRPSRYSRVDQPACTAEG